MDRSRPRRAYCRAVGVVHHCRSRCGRCGCLRWTPRRRCRRPRCGRGRRPGCRRCRRAGFHWFGRRLRGRGRACRHLFRCCRGHDRRCCLRRRRRGRTTRRRGCGAHHRRLLRLVRLLVLRVARGASYSDDEEHKPCHRGDDVPCGAAPYPRAVQQEYPHRREQDQQGDDPPRPGVPRLPHRRRRWRWWRRCSPRLVRVGHASHPRDATWCSGLFSGATGTRMFPTPQGQAATVAESDRPDGRIRESVTDTRFAMSRSAIRGTSAALRGNVSAAPGC